MTSKSAAAIKRHRTVILARLVTRAYYLYKRGKRDQMYHEIYATFVQLGGVYIKFLQGVLLRSEAMRRWHNPDRLNVFENLDTEPLDVIAILQTELSPEKLKQIKAIQPQPFAAGSFGQVYYGELADGTQIIVKVLRPMIRELLRYDLRLLGLFAKRFYKQFSPNMDYNFNEAVKDFTQATLRETDYITEANFANELFQYYQHHPKLVIPQTYLELCTPNIITQQYVGGLSAAQLLKLQQQGVDPKTYVAEQIGSDLDVQLEILGVEEMSGIFHLTRIQGDPHPGNIRLLPDNKVGMIDFGIAAMTPQNKAAFFGLISEWNRLYSDNTRIGNLFEQFIRFFVSDLYRALKKLSSMRPTENNEDYTRHVGKIAQETFVKNTGNADILPMLQDGRVLQIINQMVNKDNRFGLVMKLEASEMLRAAQTYITLVETLGRRNVVLPNVFQKVVAHVEAEFPGLAHQNDAAMSVGQALETVANWLERVAERDPVLFQQLLARIRPQAVTIKDVEAPTEVKV
ncbi:MAG TPA: AarF/UbiB family protein [Patescibacteria group bacterium]|nr:AarF/UbiB family protein [Patescibacteria group bacterium]